MKALDGGELVGGHGAHFKNRFGGTNGLPIGRYANEVNCYVPADESFPPFTAGHL